VAVLRHDRGRDQGRSGFWQLEFPWVATIKGRTEGNLLLIRSGSPNGSSNVHPYVTENPTCRNNFMG
jgi:hypothetical protein